MGFRRFSFIIGLTLLVACEHQLPVLEGVDLTAWKDDKGGCNGKRAAMIHTFQEQKAKLKGLSEMQIIELLGRPDQNELYKRNQKFFYYSFDCGRDSLARRLSVRFNATGRAKEVELN